MIVIKLSTAVAWHCLGCGELTKATERRLLSSEDGRCVAEVWSNMDHTLFLSHFISVTILMVM